MYSLETKTIQSPYCWEQFITTVDRSECEFSEEPQHYTEDCYVCYLPILLTLSINIDNDLVIQVEAELSH